MKRKLIVFAVVLEIATSGAVGVRFLNGSGQALETTLRRSIDQRAEISLSEDFQAGLDSWDGGTSLGHTWSYDASGLMIPGQLSFYKPSMRLTDYEVETRAEIVNKGFGLVFRAAGLHAYHAVRFLTEGSGAMVSMAIERYTVIDGVTSARTRIRCPMAVQRDALHRIYLQVRGDSFTLYVRGQLVDAWTDHRLPSGGVGLFCSAGERARIAWMRVSHHADLAGKLCAFVSSSLSPATTQE